MARLYLFAEGQTEQTFASSVLVPHLAAMGVYLAHIMLIAHARKRGRIHRGGGRRYKPMRDDICRRLKEDKSGDAFFTTMIDLYAIPDEFPGLVESEELRREPLRRVEALEQAFAADIGDPRFIPYIQLHEYEAYLFSDPMQFVHFYADCQEQIADLEAIARAHQTPEFINDRPDLAPSKRIIRVFPDYDGAKAVVGPLVAECIGIETIRNKCPHFNSWLLRLEGLGSARTRNAE